MIANAQIASQAPVNRADAVKGGAVSNADGSKSEFKDLLEQGLAAEEGARGTDTSKAEAGSPRKPAQFDARDPFADPAQALTVESQTVQETGGASTIDIALVAGQNPEGTDDAQLSVSQNADGLIEGGAKMATGAQIAAAEDNIRSIVNALTAKARTGQDSAAPEAVLAGAGEQKAASGQIVKSAYEVFQAGAAPVNAGGKGPASDAANAAPAISAMAAANGASAAQKQNGAKAAGLNGAIEAGAATAETGEPLLTASTKESMAKISEAVSGKEDRTIASQYGYEARKPMRDAINQPGTRVEPGAMAAAQTPTQVTAAQNMAPPPAPVKDQVLDRLGPEIRTMHGAEAAGSTQSQAGAAAAANRNVISLQLYPIGLGRVQAVLTKGSDGVKIELIVETRKTLDLLNADIDALKTSMRALGASDDNINIALGRPSNDDAAAENGRGFNAENARAGERDSDANGRGSAGADSDMDARAGDVQPSNEIKRTGYDSARMII